MMNKDIYIVGIGHNSIVTIELAKLNGYNILGLLHYNSDLTGESRWGYPVIADIVSFLQQEVRNLNFALSMGANKVREDLFNEITDRGGNLPTLIHPSATVSRFANLRKGVQIHANSTVQPDVEIKDNSIISFGVGISHNVTVNEHCYIACHSLIGAYTVIENNVLIGMGTTTVSSKVPRIGANTIVGAGSLVITEIGDKKVVYGRPAK